MKKLLTLLWVVIVAGSALIAISLFKPDTKHEDGITADLRTEDENENEVESIKNLGTKEKKDFGKYMKLGDEEFANSYYEKAVNSYTEAAKINPSSSEAFLKLGESYLKINEGNFATKAFFKAGQLNPASLNAKLGQAKAEISNRNIEAAKNIIWQLDENEAEVKYYKAIILILANKADEAKIKFQELSQLPKEEFESIVQKSEKFLDKYKIYESFIETKPPFLKVLLAQALAENKEYKAAIPLLYIVLETESNYRDAWIILGYSYLADNQTKEAIDAFDKANSISSENPKILFFLGLSYFANNQIDEAIFYLKAADKNGYEPKDQINLRLGDLYVIKKEYEDARTSYENVLNDNQENIQVFLRAAWLDIEKLNQPENALIVANLAIEKHPENAMSYNLAGWAYTALGEYQNGKEYLDKAISMDPKLDSIHLNFGWLYEKKGSTKLAKEYYKKAYILGKGNSIGNLAAIRFNKITEKELGEYYQANIASP